MKTLTIALLLLACSFAEAQVVTFDPFDTSGVANGVNIAGRRKWKAVTGQGGYLQIVNNSALMSYGATTDVYGVAMWDSAITSASMLELTIDSLGASAGSPSFYIFSQTTGTSFSTWSGYRVKWVHNATGVADSIRFERVSGGGSSNRTLLGRGVGMALQRLDKIRMYEFGYGWRSFTIVRTGTTLDSVSINDQQIISSSWTWALRGYWYGSTTASMHMDSLYISAIPGYVPSDVTPPTINSMSILPTAPDSSQSFTIQMRATDDYGLDSMAIRVFNDETGFQTDSLLVKVSGATTKDSTISFVVGPKNIGIYRYQGTAKDDSGHTTTSQAYQFSVHGVVLPTYRTYDDWKSPAIANIAGVRKKWRAMPSQPESTGVGFMINNDSTASPTNLSTNLGTSGGVFIDTVINGRSVIGFIVKSKGGTNIDMSLFQRMSDTSWATGDGYRLRVVNYGGTTGDQFRILEWKHGVETGTPGDKVGIEIQLGDTIYFKNDNTNNRLTGLVVGNGRRDSLELFGLPMNPSSYHVWMRGGKDTPWKVGNVYLDTIPPPPPLPVDPVDNVPPVIYSRGLNYGTDTTFIMRARDESSNSSWSFIPTGGLDSLYFAVYISPVNTLVYSRGIKILDARDTLLTSTPQHLSPNNYTVYSYAKDSVGNVKRDTFQFTIASTAQYWLTTYYSTWQMQTNGNWYANPPWKENWVGLTHVIAGGNDNLMSTYPYMTFLLNQADTLEWELGSQKNPGIVMKDSLVKYAHLGGAKVLQQIAATQGTAGGILNTITTDSATTDAFCQRLARYVQDHLMDGVDINWETSLGTKTQTGLLFRRLRAALNNITTGSGSRAVIHISPLSGGWGSYDTAACNAYVDQINPQEYDLSDGWNDNLGGNGNWFINPIHRRTDTPFSMRSYDTRGPLQWIAAGFKRSIMGAGLANFGRTYEGSNVLYGLHPTGRQDMVHFSNVAALKTAGFAELYDTTTHGHVVYGTTTTAYNYRNAIIPANTPFWYTYQDPRDIADQVTWVKSNNLGGIMLYDMTGDMDNTAAFGNTHPLINLFISALGNSSVTPAPTAPVPVAISGDPNNQSITGVHLFWSYPTNTQTFNFQLGTDSTFSTNIVVSATGITDSSIWVGTFPYPTLTYSTTYYWRVQALNGTGTSPYSTRQTFKTMRDPNLPFGTPPPPTLQSPSDNATSLPTVVTLRVQKLNPSDTVSVFNIWVSTDINFGNTVINDTLVGFVSGQIYGDRVLTGLSQGTSYYWKARAKNAMGWSAYATAYKFTTAMQAVVSTFKQGYELTWDPTRQSGFALETPTKKRMSYSDPASWTRPDSGNVNVYATGFWDANDATPVNLKNVSGGGSMTYTQIIAELNKTTPSLTTYWNFGAGLTVNYSGVNLMTLDAGGTQLSQLSVDGAAQFNSGITSFFGGLATDAVSTTTANTTLSLNATGLNFMVGGARTLSIKDATSGAGQSLTIIGQRGVANQVGGDLYLRGGPGNVSGNGGNVYLVGGAVGGGTGSTAGKVVFPSGGLQYLDGNQGAGKVMTSDPSGNITLQPAASSNPSMKSYYRFQEDWDVVGIGSFGVASTNSNTFDHRWISVVGGAAHSGNIISVDIDTVGVADSSDCSVVKFTTGGVDSVMGTGVVATLIPSGRGSVTRTSVYMRKFGLTMNVKFSMPQTTAGMDSTGVIWGFTGSTTDGEDYSTTNSAGVYLQYANKLAGGNQDSIYAVVASGSAKTKKGIIKPTTSQVITSSIWIDANGFNFKVNSTTITIPWTDANIPSATQRAVPILSTIQYGNATSGKVYRHYYYEFYFPTDR